MIDKVSEAGLGGRAHAVSRFVARGGSGPVRGRAGERQGLARRILADRLYVIDDRVLPLAGGVAYYALLAVFPAVAMTVSLYSLFADASTVSRHLVLLTFCRRVAQTCWRNK